METSRAARADLLDPAHLAAPGRGERIARWVVDGCMVGLARFDDRVRSAARQAGTDR